ncbi:MAG: tail-specific protease [Verrucomicrobia bacterium]|nr:MAG: tail-specific protease [Verrucomicrobiota bacterium]
MINRFLLQGLLLLLSCKLVLPVFAREVPITAPPELPSAPPHILKPGADDGQIAYWTAILLENAQYLRKPFDSSVSSKFLDRYLDYLDPAHMHFLQSDLAQFEPFRTSLDRLTLNKKDPNATPASVIFNRFLERQQEQVDFVDALLKNEKFTFDTDERILLNRHDAPYPKDLNELQKLWRDRLRYEYLQEKLGRVGAKKTDPSHSTASGSSTNAAPATPPKTEDEEIVDLLRHRYHRILRTYTDFNNEDVLQIYLSALTHVYDPHSDYFNRATLEQFSIGMNLSLFGIGAELGTTEDGYCYIRRLLPGGPAVKSKKLNENDRIVAVAQSNQPPVDIIDMNLNKAVQLIRGPKDTEVRLTVQPADGGASNRKIISLTRDEIPLEDSAAKSKVIDWPTATGDKIRLGIVDLPAFYAPFNPGNTKDRSLGTNSPSADVARLLQKMEREGVQGVILDLRRNGGGSLEEAVRLTGLFIKEGPVVQVKDYQGRVEVLSDDDPAVVYDGPLIVLTSRFSASASEIVAGALQDYGRALLVGDAATHGKGTVQSVHPLIAQMGSGPRANDPGAVKLTIKKFYRASGVSTQKRGVIPDIILPSIWNDNKDIGESALENPLECDTNRAAKYEALNRVEPYLATLRKRSSERVAADPEFGYVREEIALLKKSQADKTGSLNLKERLKEKEETDSRNKARDKERLARKPSLEIVHDLPLKDVDKPGLPAPTPRTNSATAKLSIPKSAIVSTNSSLALAKTDKGSDHKATEEEDEKPPAVDATLEEAEHILVDYLDLYKKGSIAAVSQGHPAPVAETGTAHVTGDGTASERR